jgi:soluble lytic murein transglycosylase
VEGALFAEIIPFSETRGYVKSVMANATYYAALMEGRAQSLKARLGTIAPKNNQGTSLP